MTSRGVRSSDLGTQPSVVSHTLRISFWLRRVPHGAVSYELFEIKHASMPLLRWYSTRWIHISNHVCSMMYNREKLGLQRFWRCSLSIVNEIVKRDCIAQGSGRIVVWRMLFKSYSFNGFIQSVTHRQTTNQTPNCRVSAICIWTRVNKKTGERMWCRNCWWCLEDERGVDNFFLNNRRAYFEA